MARNDYVIPSHTCFDHPVANSCLSHSYNVQVKNTAIFQKRIDDFL
ncbi:hypothetical protein MKX62_05720 [Sporosarcina sp. FSL K6-5500]